MKKVMKKKATKKSASVKKANSKNDIINLIMEDHKPLKQLIKILKNSDKKIEIRMAAFDEFAPLLANHAKSEEQSLYVSMKQDKELRSEALEGDVEHGLADQMLEEVKRTTDEDLWTARVKVLAELVEHHIKEEEEELLPDYRKNSELEERINLGQMFLKLKTYMAEQGNDDAPAENTIEANDQQAEIHTHH